MEKKGRKREKAGESSKRLHSGEIGQVRQSKIERAR